MKRITLTEDQYCYILSEKMLSNKTVISESAINEGIVRALFRGCRSFTSYVDRLGKLILAGAITGAVAMHYFRQMFPNAGQKEIQKVEEVIKSAEQQSPLKKDTHTTSPAYNTKYKISSKGIQHIKQHESVYYKGYSATPAEAGAGKVTVGVGHVITDKDPQKLQNIKKDFLLYLSNNPGDFKGKNYAPSKGCTLTDAEVDQLLSKDLAKCENYVKILCVKANKKFEDPRYFNQGFMDAMIDLMMSGYGNFEKSPFYGNLKKCRIVDGKIEEGDFNVTVASLKRSVTHQGKKELDGLKKRRYMASELALADR